MSADVREALEPSDGVSPPCICKDSGASVDEAGAPGGGAAAASPRAPEALAKDVGTASGINIAGRSFAGRDEVVAHIKAIQAAASDGDGLLRPEDAFFLLHLLSHNHLFAEKVKAPLIGFRYGECPGFRGTKSFLTVHSDKSVSGISWQKSLDVLCPKKGTKRPREDSEPVKQPADHADQQTNLLPQQNPGVLEEKGQREIAAAEPPANAPSGDGHPIGTVLEVRGLPAQTEYGAVRAALEERFGKVQFAEMLRIPGKARAAVPDEWREDELADMLTATARVRFEAAESATRAASEFVDFGSAKVHAFVLSGEAEDAYWKRLQKNMQRKRVGWGEGPSRESVRDGGNDGGLESRGGRSSHGRGGGRGHPEGGRGRGRTGRGYNAAPGS